MIALIDYGMGNLFSVKKAFLAVGAKNLEITNNPDFVRKASAIILPGVGNFGIASNNLRALDLDRAIKDSITSGKPFLGICLGLQLLMSSSEEALGCSRPWNIKRESNSFQHRSRPENSSNRLEQYFNI